MGGLGSSGVEPPAWRVWLVRAGLTKARDAEIPWLVSELDRAELERPVRRRWMLAVRAVASLAVASLLLLTRGTFAVTYVAAFVGVNLVAAWWAPASIFRYQRRSVLRVHGRNELGGTAESPTRWARLDPAAYSLVQASFGVALIGVIVAAVSLLSRPGEVTVLECLRGGGQVAVIAEVTGRGVLADAPTVDWIDPGSGAVLASTRLRYDGVQAVHLPIADPASAALDAPTAVSCRVDD